MGKHNGKVSPWNNCKGKSYKVSTLGAVVEIEEGITGLIHISQISLKRIKKPEDALQLGQEVEAKVVEVRPEERKMRLSIRALQEETIRKKVKTEKEVESKYIVDEKDVDKLKFLKG